MTDVLVWLAAVGFLISVFPVHVYNYVYINTSTKYASINAGAYGINFFNANTVENHPREMQINGKKKNIDASTFKMNFYKIFNQVCIYKIVQLGDYGMQKDANAYILLLQSGLTTAIYKFLQMNGNYGKLRNYVVLNAEHSEIRYYLKAVTVLNLIVFAKILLIIILEKINERKN
ncbi:MAG: hypothetical protein K2O89_03475 [Clostridia bacterium]|nr:hypothetical protein [Clostridia bacterium]